MCEHLKDQDKIILRYSKEIDKADPNEIANLCWNLWKQNGFMYSSNDPTEPTV